jgi:uncharacterized HAD superfamily protein
MNIAFDIDGVAVDTMSTFCYYGSILTGKSLSVRDIKDYNIHPSLDITPQQVELIIEATISRSLNLQMYEGFNNIFRLAQLLNTGVDVEFVTARSERFHFATFQMLKAILRTDNFKIHHSKDKLEHVKHYDFFFEDCIETVNSLFEKTNATFFVPIRPWNQDKIKASERIIPYNYSHEAVIKLLELT